LNALIEEGKFGYYKYGENPKTIILLHGLMGGLSNFEGLINHFISDYTIYIPHLPICELPLREANIDGLLQYVEDFVEHKSLSNFHLLGNSLGGHLALLYTLKHQDKLNSLILTGSSGLFENSLGTTFPRRGDYEFIKERTEKTFYDPKKATKALVDEVFEMVNNNEKAIRIVTTAKSAIRHNVEDKLYQIQKPTLLIWGNDDTITPAFVGKEFNEKIKNSELHYIDKCGHAPMMEHPETFCKIMEQFLHKIK
jgi:2-hydroxy-6-oxonona-2,4-dienedioate hydrolase